MLIMFIFSVMANGTSVCVRVSVCVYACARDGGGGAEGMERRYLVRPAYRQF